MSDQTPGQHASQPTTEHLDVGDGARVRPVKERGPKRSRKGLLIGGGVAAALLVGGGVWAWTSFFAQGPQPAEALPDSTLAYVSIDLDPPGQQKVEAIKTLRKFPAFRDEIGLDTDDDVRKEVFGALQDDGLCEDVDYADDVEPWLGDRAAFALVDQGDGEPAPVFVVQIKDQDDAEGGLKKLTACATDAVGAEEELGGYAFNGDWVVLAGTEAIAEDVVEAAGDGSLADDGDYTKWTEAAGDPGIVTMYAAPEAGKALLEVSGFGMMGSSGDYAESSSSEASMAPAAYQPADDESDGVDVQVNPLETESPRPSEDPNQVPGTVPSRAASPNPSNMPTELPSDFPTELPSDFPTDLPSDFPSDFPTEAPSFDPSDFPSDPEPEFEENPYDDEMPLEVQQMLEDFPGGALVLRFEDGGFEMEGAMGELDATITDAFDTDRGGDMVDSLPASTAVAYGLGFSDGWLGALIEEFRPMIEESAGEGVDEALAAFEEEFGISVPEDIETLTGETAAAALDSDFDPRTAEDSPEELPAGFVVRGDPDEIEKVLEKIRVQAAGRRAGPDGVARGRRPDAGRHQRGLPRQAGRRGRPGLDRRLRVGRPRRRPGRLGALRQLRRRRRRRVAGRPGLRVRLRGRHRERQAVRGLRHQLVDRRRRDPRPAAAHHRGLTRTTTVTGRRSPAADRCGGATGDPEQVVRGELEVQAAPASGDEHRLVGRGPSRPARWSVPAAGRPARCRRRRTPCSARPRRDRPSPPWRRPPPGPVP